jgi:hypothetical protein
MSGIRHGLRHRGLGDVKTFFGLVVLLGASCGGAPRPIAPDAASDADGLVPDASRAMDSGGTTTDAGTVDARADADIDSGLPAPSPSDLIGLLCAPDGSPPPGGSCPTQARIEASSCAGEGSVVFDGRDCTLAAGEECGPVRGAFGSVEACAEACSAAGQCSPEDLREWVSSCDRVWLYVNEGYDLPSSLCGAAAAWSCAEPAPDPAYGIPGRRCWREGVDEIEPAEMREMCAMTLLPTVSRLRCFNQI